VAVAVAGGEGHAAVEAGGVAPEHRLEPALRGACGIGPRVRQRVIELREQALVETPPELELQREMQPAAAVLGMPALEAYAKELRTAVYRGLQ
jgi:hypothetical protein